MYACLNGTHLIKNISTGVRSRSVGLDYSFDLKPQSTVISYCVYASCECSDEAAHSYRLTRVMCDKCHNRMS